jgi:cellulose synthase/poly-beta-1,6-N-acetylglucosamine synthase-like glycosyltransferase
MTPLTAIRRAVIGSLGLLAASAVVPSAYLAALTAAALRGQRTAPLPSPAPIRFAVCIPAHNEAATIASSVAAIRAQAYPADLVDVYVVADNCTDATVEIARGAGAIVHDRVVPEHRGKGPALNWLHQRIERGSFDVLVVIDADTIAEQDFLKAMSSAFAGDTLAAQGYYGVQRPATSTSVALRYAALTCRHHLRPLGRTVLGGSCGLFGNGMAFRADLLDTRAWSGHLVEDAEFQLELLLDDVIVAYVPGARVAAEMPDSLEGATTQNERWELGRLQLVKRFAPTLLTRSLRGGTLPRTTYIDAAADLLVPPLSVLAALDLAVITLGGVVRIVFSKRLGRVVLTGGLLSGTTLAMHVLIALRTTRSPASVYRSLLSAPSAILWKLGLLTRVARRPDNVAWTRTTRNQESAA